MRVDEAEAEGLKERKLRERSEEYTRSLESELEKLQQYATKQGGGAGAWTEPQELSRYGAVILSYCTLLHLTLANVVRVEVTLARASTYNSALLCTALLLILTYVQLMQNVIFKHDMNITDLSPSQGEG